MKNKQGANNTVKHRIRYRKTIDGKDGQRRNVDDGIDGEPLDHTCYHAFSFRLALADFFS